MAEPEEHRTSERTTKGVPPSRWGFEEGESSYLRRPGVGSGNRMLQSGSGRGSPQPSTASSTSGAKRAMLEAQRRLAQADVELAKLALEEATSTRSRRTAERSSSPRMMREVFDEADAMEELQGHGVLEQVGEKVSSNSLSVSVDPPVAPQHARVEASSAESNIESVQNTAHAKVESAHTGSPTPSDALGDRNTCEVLVNVARGDVPSSETDAAPVNGECNEAMLRRANDEFLRKERALQDELFRIREELADIHARAAASEATVRQLNGQLAQCHKLLSMRTSDHDQLNNVLQDAYDENGRLQRELRMSEEKRVADSQSHECEMAEHQENCRAHIQTATHLESEVSQLRALLNVTTTNAERAQDEANSWRRLFLQECAEKPQSVSAQQSDSSSLSAEPTALDQSRKMCMKYEQSNIDPDESCAQMYSDCPSYAQVEEQRQVSGPEPVNQVWQSWPLALWEP